jgi:hypothetical protein
VEHKVSVRRGLRGGMVPPLCRLSRPGAPPSAYPPWWPGPLLRLYSRIDQRAGSGLDRFQRSSAAIRHGVSTTRWSDNRRREVKELAARLTQAIARECTRLRASNLLPDFVPVELRLSRGLGACTGGLLLVLNHFLKHRVEVSAQLPDTVLERPWAGR